MSEELEDDLDTQERQAIDLLAKEAMPPPFLEEQIVEALKTVHLIRSPRLALRFGSRRIGIAVTASLALFVLGAVAGSWWTSGSSPRPDLPEFMLVLRSSSQDANASSSDEVRQSVAEYSAWAGEIRKTGLLLGGEKLKGEARLLSVSEGRTLVSESSASPADSVIEGYFLIQATDYQQAVSIASGCPHLKYGGTVEVRQIDRF